MKQITPKIIKEFLMKKTLYALAAVTCLSASLYGSFPGDLQRALLGKDPVARRMAAKQALAQFGNNALKLSTYTGMSIAQLKQLAAETAASAPVQTEAKPAIMPVKPLMLQGAKTGPVPAIAPPSTTAAAPKGGLPAPEGKAAAEEKAQEQKAENQPNYLEAFPLLKEYGLFNKLTAARLQQDPAWNEFVEGNSGMTFEDVYRIILGLPRDYTLGSKLEAYKALALKWHPDRQAGKSDEEKAMAEGAFALIGTANRGLERALQEKAFGKK